METSNKGICRNAFLAAHNGLLGFACDVRGGGVAMHYYTPKQWGAYLCADEPKAVGDDDRETARASALAYCRAKRAACERALVTFGDIPNEVARLRVLVGEIKQAEKIISTL